MPVPPVTAIKWDKAYRIVSTLRKPVELFERVADPAEWDTLLAIYAVTDLSIMEKVGNLSLVPVKERVSGPGASWVMTCFTHVAASGSRFATPAFGAYYAANTRNTAILETVYHYGRFYASTDEPAMAVRVRLLAGGVSGNFHDIRGGHSSWTAVYDPNDYRVSQDFATKLRESDSEGIMYDSVRCPSGGECVAAFTPRVVQPPAEVGILRYHWNGAAIDQVDFGDNDWKPLPGKARE